MKENSNAKRMTLDYIPPECSIIKLEKEDILTSSSIKLPMQPLYDDDLQLG